jgi:NhaP-type Na+/H+ or K+/H+ antiporter
MDPIVAALLATILAPTDAALGAPVVTDEAVPAKIREALNVESGLNDGIYVPIVIILLDLVVGSEVEHSGMRHIFKVIVEEIGIGLLVAVLIVPPAVWVLRVAARRQWMSVHWLHVPVVALAGLCFASTQALGGSGFIACFVGGLLFGYLEDRPQDLLGGATSTGEVLAMLTWIAFGGPLLGLLLHQITWSMVAYAVLSLTVVRMAPVFLSLAGCGMTAGEKLFVGWFGPRGLASIVFAVIIFDAAVPGRDALAITTACTILLSILAHGATANPLVSMLLRSRRNAG